MWKSKKVAQILSGELIGAEEVTIHGCVLDSRQAKGGEIFFALPGEKVDGHDYITAAWSQGAVLAVAQKARFAGEEDKPQVPPGKALVLVDSTVEALPKLAKAWRQELKAKVVGITGSNGKTTTKDMVAAVLARKYKVHKNRENQNNELGLPLTILNAPPGTEILVLEMGMRGLGQIKSLCEIARPDTGVITNIGTTHLELLGTQEAIAQAKWELIDALPPEGFAVLNSEDFWSTQKAKSDSHPLCFYGLEGKYHRPDVQGNDLVPAGELGTYFMATWQGKKVRAYLPLPGEHNVLDALAALAVGTIYGVSLEEGCQGLAQMELSQMRLELHQGIYGSTLISDVYNANPSSMQASLKVLKERAKDKTLAILGEMYELGEASQSGHFNVGRTVAELSVNVLITVGEMAKEIARGALENGLSPEYVYICLTREEAVQKAKEVLERLGPHVWVLIKASRGMKMEEVTKALLEG